MGEIPDQIQAGDLFRRESLVYAFTTFADMLAADYISLGKEVGDVRESGGKRIVLLESRDVRVQEKVWVTEERFVTEFVPA